jgi:ribonucleoside-triphosphate reductase (thioredoxin)
MYEVIENKKHLFADTTKSIADYIFTSKYARYLEEHNRRETWGESVDRVKQMHLKKYDFLDASDKHEIEEVFDLVGDKKVLPSMRSMQFGGKAVEAHNARLYNCAVMHVDSIRSFSEAFYLLLCGCGVGFGLTDKYLNRLPNLVGPEDKTGIVMTYVVEDSIEGWADSVEALLNCYFVNTAYSGRKIVFDYSRIRPEGSPLVTGGGKAPGHEGLKAAHVKIKGMLDFMIEEQGLERMRTIDAYDILMHTSDAVLSGGVRRSATSVVFSKDDDLMLNAKVGNWFEENPQRARSNNSVLLIRGEISEEEFTRVAERTRQWGEPGFVFGDTEDVLFNPCFEISFIPKTDDGVCGVQFCNLSTINGNLVLSEQDFYDYARAAAIIGTLQAGYTDFKYLSHVARELTEEEALLGVSITAMMDSPDIIFNEEIQQRAASIVVETNKKWAEKLGINPAARTTAIKPEGTSTLAVGSMSSGIHASHSKYMFRRVQANKQDNVYRLFKQLNPGACEHSVWSANGTDDVITFPIVVRDGAIFKKDISAIDHLDMIRSTQRNWVVPGTTSVNKKPIHHNVSCTVIVQDDEWELVEKYLYANREDFTAVSLLGATGDKDYAQAPNEAVVTKKDEEAFVSLMMNWVPVDYQYLVETEDGTSFAQEAACAGPIGCEVK